MRGDGKVTKIAILGSAPSVTLAPFEDPSWQIWACSPANIGQLPRTDLWFEMHDIFRIKRAWKDEQRVFQWLNAQAFGVMMQEKNDIVPRAQRYPIETILEEFSPYFLNSSVAYILALALVRYAKEPGFEFGLWGVNMAGDGEYGFQRADILYMLDWAVKRSLKFYVPAESCLLAPPIMYGYSEGNHMAVELETHWKKIQAQKEEVKRQLDELHYKEGFLNGVEQGIGFVRRTWLGVENVPGRFPKSPPLDSRSEHGRREVEPSDALLEDQVRQGAGGTFP